MDSLTLNDSLESAPIGSNPEAAILNACEN